MSRGTPSIFAPKDPETRLQGVLTTTGGKRLEDAKVALATLYYGVMGEEWDRAVSDADAVEFLARGRSATVRYLKMKKPGSLAKANRAGGRNGRGVGRRRS